MAIPVLSAFCIFLFTLNHARLFGDVLHFGFSFCIQKSETCYSFLVVVTGAYFAFVDIGHICTVSYRDFWALPMGLVVVFLLFV